MSKRRNIGEKVWVDKFFGGLSGGWAVIPNNPENENPAPCPLCEEPDCREWATLWECNDRGQVVFPGSMYFHVSECQMEDGPE